MRPRVVVTHWVHDEVVRRLAGFCDPRIPTRAEGVWPRDRIAELAADADGLIVCMADRVDAELLDGCPRLRIVSGTLKGHDNLDVAACTRRGVWVTVLPDLLTVPTAELTVGLTIGVMRRIGEGDRFVRSGTFAGWRPRLYGSGLAGATVGIVGMGRVGRAVARRLAAFDAHVVHNDVRPEAGGVGLPDLLAASDVVIPLLPLTPGTRGLIGAGALRRMRPGGYVVNVSRGSVVDEEAIAGALDAGTLAGYAADVFAMEDLLQAGRPRTVPPRLSAHPRTLFTPHLGSAVDDVRRRMSLAAAEQVRQVLDGRRPEQAVNDPARRPGAGGFT